MPRQLALLLCSAVVFYLLRYDRRQAAGVSWVLWIPSLWMLVIASSPIDRLFGLSTSRESGGVIDPIWQSGLLCFGLAILAKRHFSWSTVVRENLWLIVLIGYMLVSVLWSDMPFRSFKGWIKEVVAVVMALVVLSEAAPQEALKSLLRRIVYVLIPFSVLFVKYYPDRGVIYSRFTGEIQWIGVTMQKNGLGQLCLICTFFLVWTFIRRWRGRDDSVSKNQTRAEIALLFITLWLLKGPSAWAASATSMFTLSLGLATLFGLLWTRKHIPVRAPTWVTIIACIIGLGTTMPLVGGFNVTGVTSALGRDSTLTGRTEIWAGVMPEMLQQPLVGHGFCGFWTDLRIAEQEINEAHNGYLEICLGLGFIGLFLTGMFLLSSSRRFAALLVYDYDWGCLCICILLMATVHNISEASFDSFQRFLMAMILFLSISIPAMKRRPGLQQLAVR